MTPQEQLTDLLRTRCEWAARLHAIEDAQREVQKLYLGVRREFVKPNDIEDGYCELFDTDSDDVRMRSLEDLVDRSKVTLVEVEYKNNDDVFIPAGEDRRPQSLSNKKDLKATRQPA
jgi:hypothetical protein